jgi:hypothetical protein
MFGPITGSVATGAVSAAIEAARADVLGLGIGELGWRRDAGYTLRAAQRAYTRPQG